MLPESQHTPSDASQPLIRVGIPGPIGFDLISPEVGVSFRPSCMLRAAVPETAIDENGQSNTRKGYVGYATRLLQHLESDSIAQPHFVKFTA